MKASINDTGEGFTVEWYDENGIGVEKEFTGDNDWEEAITFFESLFFE